MRGLHLSTVLSHGDKACTVGQAFLLIHDHEHVADHSSHVMQ